MLISLFAMCIGATIGRIRGGSHRGVVYATIRGKGYLIAAIAASLVLTVLDPGQPMFWMAIAVVGGFGFGLSNLHLTGMIVFLMGLSLNVLAIITNGAMPVSEQALRSVGDVDSNGEPIIEGIREAVSSAPNLSVLGDIIPVPLFGAVVSIGDLIMMVALADIVANLFLRDRARPDEDGIYFASDDTDEDELVIDLTDSALETDRALETDGPAHATKPKVRITPPLPRVRRPQHAKPAHATEGGLAKFDEQPPPPTGAPILAPPPLTADKLDSQARPSHAPRRRTREVAAVEGEEVIDLREAVEAPPKLDLTDNRPIIDLTMSPTDEQLAEFLRRRCDADRRLAEAQLSNPAPGHRRNRLRARRNHHSRTGALR